jgi:hypothetical protein
MKGMGRRSAIFGLTVVLLVAAQCFAVCSVMPCTLPQKAACHHKPDKAPCAHEGFVTEGASKPDVTPAIVARAFVPEAGPWGFAEFAADFRGLGGLVLPSFFILRI